MLSLIFIFGLIIGSFLNVIIYRIPNQESIVRPRSRCTVCGHDLTVNDLVPLLSFIWLKGKCRYCNAKISIQYPLVELITAVIFLLVFLKGGLSTWTLAGLIFTSVLIVASFTDIKDGIIPDLLTYPSLILGLALSFFTIGIKSALIGALAFALVFYVIAFITKGGMGGGDIKLAGVIGAFLGPVGSFMVFLLSSLLALIGVIPLLVKGKATRKTMVKFGPFLAIAATLVYIYGNEILYLYFRILGL